MSKVRVIRPGEPVITAMVAKIDGFLDVVRDEDNARAGLLPALYNSSC